MTSTLHPQQSAQQPLHAQWDGVGEQRLRERGSKKWTTCPDALGGFIAEIDFGTAPAVVACVQEAAASQRLGYLSQPVIDAAISSYTAWARRRLGWEVPAVHVRLVPDVLGALEFTLRHLIPAGSTVVVPTPAYMPFLTIPGIEGHSVVEVPMAATAAGSVLHLEAMERALEDGAALVMLCNPHNPTGRVLSRRELEEVSALVARFPGVRVFCDEIHAGVVGAGLSHLPFASLNPTAALQAITATSTSKSFGLPGLKCAQLILSNPQDREVWAAKGKRTEDLTSIMGALAASAAYDQGDEWLDRLGAYIDAERDLLVSLIGEHLPGVTLARPEGTYIAWLDCSQLNLNESPAAFFLREAGVALTDGAECGAGFEQHVRLVFATPRPLLRRMIESMGQAVRRHRDGIMNA